MMALEQAYDRSVDELAFSKASTVADLEALMRAEVVAAQHSVHAAPPEAPFEFPSWNRTAPAEIIRRASLGGLVAAADPRVCANHGGWARPT